MDYTLLLAIWLWGLIPATIWVFCRIRYTIWFPSDIPYIFMSWLVWPLTLLILIYVAVFE